MSEKQIPKRVYCEGVVPFHYIEGEAEDCGIMLAERWYTSMRHMAENPTEDSLLLLKNKRLLKLYDRYIPCYPEFLKGLAKGADLPEDKLFSQFAAGKEETCTSFAIQPSATLDRVPMSGQTKDTPLSRIFRYQVIGLKIRDGMEVLTLTYPGWLFGHGFVVGGCSVFRNSLSCGTPEGFLPYDVWGMLIQNCKNIEEVKRLTTDNGVMHGFHTTVADEHGNIVGIEAGKAGYGFIEPKDGIYTHANHCSSGAPLVQYEEPPVYGLGGSVHREKRLFELLNKDNGYLTSQLAYAAMTDHDNYPDSICSEARIENHATTAAVIVEPLRRKLHVTRGLPSQNWPVTYTI